MTENDNFIGIKWQERDGFLMTLNGEGVGVMGDRQHLLSPSVCLALWLGQPSLGRGLD